MNVNGNGRKFSFYKNYLVYPSLFYAKLAL